ncbi:tRNA1(Val) (adenine(37)-N6)-methyltransferase [Alteromonas sp. D210916BOD_24]|uniref:tRNA1(Val) (adenine(37)-N6)-methyltransferase n=1 Tax=Alteromonas sp. D210916BOD_24 TaxID=3157618 RepID=UPI00399D3B72
MAQDKCAMKVNTDSLILGSWVRPQQASSILDIGTGSGILALMLAQTSMKGASIDALEIDEDTAKQAADNVKGSPWPEKIQVFNTDLADFVPSMSYDIIVSNPPYFDTPTAFTKAYHTQTTARHTARQTAHLTPEDVFNFCVRHLNEKGSLYCVYPYQFEQKILSVADDVQLRPTRILYVKHNQSANPYLCAFQFKKAIREKPVSTETMLIRKESGEYTEEYKKLCSAFYLKF